MVEQRVCPRCAGTRVIRFGTGSGRQRWHCRTCGRTWSESLGTPLFHLHTPLPEIVRTIRIVMSRGSLRAAEEQTGHNYDTIAAWIRRLGKHAEAVTEVLVGDLNLSAVEMDEFWSFVGKKGGDPRRRGQAILPQVRRPASAGVR